MRKWTIIAASIVLALSLAACGTNNGNAENSANSGSNGAAAEDKTYKFATDAAYAPMEYMDGDKIVGFDIDFLAAVMEEAGLKYEINNTGWEPMLLLVSEGKEYDAGISSITITDERKETYDFSKPYFESSNVILVKEGSDIKNALDLKEKNVGVQISTTADTLMTEIMGNGSTKLKRYETNVLALMELDGGGVDAVVADIAAAGEYLKNNPDKKYNMITDTENFGAEYYGIAFPKDSELKAKLDPAIDAVIENGKYAEIYKEWFGEEPNTDALTNAAE